MHDAESHPYCCAQKGYLSIFEEAISLRYQQHAQEEKTGIKFTTLVGVINAFQEKQILIETTGYSRNQVFAFQKYIDLFLK